MKIKFDNFEYQLVSDYSYNVEPTHFQANVVKKTTFDDLINNTTEVETITILTDEDEIIGVYNGYTKRTVITIYDNEDSASVEFLNTDLEAQINAMTNSILQLQQNQASQEEEINGKLDSSTLGNEEEIGQPSQNPYQVGDTFVSNGQYYRVTVPILTGNILVEGGNCELTNINETIQSLKEDET